MCPGWAEARSGYLSPAGRGIGLEFVQVAPDDASRRACVEVLADERGETATGALEGMIASFGTRGIQVRRVLAGNGSCYRAGTFGQAARARGAKPKRTRRHRPQTRGKVEPCIRVRLREQSLFRQRAAPRRASRIR